MTIHIFTDTGEAYDAANSCDKVKRGDILLVENEGVIGIADAWPIAITGNNGVFHTTIDADPLDYLTKNGLAANYAAARELANEKGFALRNAETDAQNEAAFDLANAE